jgi:hypothetical protein
MKKAVNILVASCVLGALSIAPVSSNASSAVPSASTVPSVGLSAGLVEAAPSLALVTGTVKDEHGSPLMGAVVALFQPQPRGRELLSVRTDAHGKFSANIAPGIYRLRATAEGFVTRLLPRINIDRPVRVTYDFQLKRTNTLVQKRGDSDDYRWIARSAPRQVLNLQESEETEEGVGVTDNDKAGSSQNPARPPIHGMTQLMAVGSAGRAGDPGSNFFGTNFAFSSTLPGNLEMALIGQKGMGNLAPNRLSAIASMRPSDKHQLTASIGYGQITHELSNAILSNSMGSNSLEQFSVSAIGSWQVFRPLILIYGFDYSSFLGSATSQSDSVLPRFAMQYAPSARTRLKAAVTPGADQYRSSAESFNTENIQASFEDAPPEVAFNEAPILDRSQRFEAGIERIFGDGDSALEASAFYDLISGHGVGVLALPLEASPETQVTLQQVAHRVTAMNGAARGIRVIFRRNLDEHLTASVGYSVGRGMRFNNNLMTEITEPVTPADIFKGGFFQVATAKLDIDLRQETGTSISTVIRLSPSAVVFAIDPFAGRMSVYDPNINIYVTQELPSFGLPGRWQALVDLRNVLDRAIGVEEGNINMIAARARRTLRGGLAFRW